MHRDSWDGQEVRTVGEKRAVFRAYSYYEEAPRGWCQASRKHILKRLNRNWETFES